VSVNRVSEGSFVQFNQEQKLCEPPYRGFLLKFRDNSPHMAMVYAQWRELFRGIRG
jgi:hypothetical protein